MKGLADLANLVRENLKEHAPRYLSGAAIVGTISTAYLTAKATWDARGVLEAESQHNGFKEDAKLVWKLYIPPAASAVVTVACIISAHSLGARKYLAAQAAFAISERAYSEYRDKVAEEFGENKARSVRDKVAEDRVKGNPPPEIILASGNVLCCELFTGRYFQSDIETLKKARNELNAKILAHDYATLDDWYYLIGIPYTSYSSEIGWKSGRLMELEFTSVLTEDGRPCLAFDYNYTKPM